MQKTAIIGGIGNALAAIKSINWTFHMKVSAFVIVWVLLTANLLIAEPGRGQTTDGKVINMSYKRTSLHAIIKSISEQADVVIMYEFTSNMENSLIDFTVKNKSLQQTLDLLIQERNIKWSSRNNIILIEEIPEKFNRADDDRYPSVYPILEIPPITVRGRIVNENNDPVIASIVIKDTKKGTTSNASGEFELDNVREDAILIISSANTETVTIKVDGNTMLNIVVRSAISDLGEVVINKGYYSERRKLSTGNVSKVGEKEIDQQPVTNVIGALTGRVPGLEITQGGGVPGAGFKIRIRGQNSIAAGASPLFVIDGVPFASESLGSNQVGRQLPFIDGNIAVSPFNSLNPADIASIEVLKDADATAIYGSRGANGVVLITTKKGKAGKTQYDFRVMAGFSDVARKFEMLNTQEYLALRKKLYADAGVQTYPSFEYDINGTWDSSRYTDWQKELIGGTAKNLNGQVGVSGGTDRTQFLIRASVQKETTVYPGDFHYDRGSFLVNLAHRSANDRFKLSFTANYNTDNNNMAGDDLTRTAMYLAPNAPALYSDDGSLNWENSTWSNPLASQNTRYDGKTRLLNSNLTLDFDLGAGFALKLNSGYGDYRLNEYFTSPSTVYDPAYQLTAAYAYAYAATGSRQNWIVEPQVNWSKKWNNSVLQALAGATFQNQRSDRLVNSGSGFPSNSLIYDITAATYPYIALSENPLYKYHAVFGRLNYNWKEKYLINLTARRDGSSRFSPERQFANFGAIGAAWIFTAEPFIQHLLPFINYGKLRGSYGTTGNDQIGDYQFLNTYAPASGTLYQGVVGLQPQRLYNPDFGWETNKKFEAALEAGMLNDRIFLAAAWYRNRSSSQLVGIPLSAATGFTSIQSNLPALVQNTGWEFEVQVTPVRNKSVKWNISLNLSIPRNKLIEFPNLEASAYANTYVVGQPLTIVRKYHMTGTDPVTGVYQYLDVNKDGQLSSVYDRTSIHNMASQYFGGINNSLTVGNWQLDVFVQMVKKTGNNYLYYIGPPGAYNGSIPRAALKDVWEPGRTDATMQVLYVGGYNTEADLAWNRLYTSSAAVDDIFFARLKNVALSYKIPGTWIKKTEGRFFVQGQNLATFTKYEGLDPETESLNALSPLRTITFGIQLTL